MSMYGIVIERAERNLAAYVPDLPGCIATGTTEAEVRERIRVAIRWHLEGLREDGLPAPLPSSLCEYVEA